MIRGPLIPSPQDAHEPTRLMSIATGPSGRPIYPSGIPGNLWWLPSFENSHRERSVFRKPKPSGSLGRQGKWLARQLTSTQGEMVTNALAL